jgi:phage gpG-like protein
MSVQIHISEEAKGVFRDAYTFRERLVKRIAVVQDKQNELTVSWIIAARLSEPGEFTLGVRSGRLRRSIRAAKSRISGTTIYSSIGSNVRYAGAHEFGFKGTVTVQAHTRRFARFSTIYNRLQPIPLKDAQALQKRGKKINARLKFGQSEVRSHQRRMNIPARAPIASGLVDRLDVYAEAISDGVIAAWNGRTT